MDKLMNLDDFFRGIGVTPWDENDSESQMNSTFVNTLLEFSVSEVDSEALYQQPLDSSTYHSFTEEEFKLQPMVRKSRKQLTPEEQKDARYWDKRAKNNYAAKRSRESRRARENQIVLRVNFLEKENLSLKKVLKKLKQENDELKNMLTH